MRSIVHNHGASHYQPPINPESRAQSHAEAHCRIVEDLRSSQAPHITYGGPTEDVAYVSTCVSRSLQAIGRQTEAGNYIDVHTMYF